MKKIIEPINRWLTNYLYVEGDTTEVIIQKKIFWLIYFLGMLSIILALNITSKEQTNKGKEICDLIFGLSLPITLIAFHFHRRHIEWWALLSQLGVVLICAAKVYYMGGLLRAGAPIFIGFQGPVFALIMPKRKRAFYIYGLYLFLMIGFTVIQPVQPEGLSVSLYLYGFIAGTFTVFLIIYYFTSQVEKLKAREKAQMKRMDEFKTRFYTNITHEFRTPLTIILGMAEQLVSSTPTIHSGNSENGNRINWKEGLHMISRNGRNLLNLTNQMLNLSKLEAGAMPLNMVHDDICVFLKYIVESFQSFAKTKNIELKISINPDTIEMDFDPEKISEIVSNLISNAIKFTPSGGFVHVICSKKILENFPVLTVVVKDNGPGIPKENLNKVFDRFFQVENQKDKLVEGTGLGLSVTKELVNLLKGEITVFSPADAISGKGTQFTVQLPITSEIEVSIGIELKDKSLSVFSIDKPNSKLEKETTLKLEKEAEVDKLKILIVEDNQDVIRYLSVLLDDLYDLILANNGKVGFEKAVKAIPDLVITDVMMPVMDGFELCSKLKSDLRTSHIPVIVLTAKADTASKIEGLDAGADAYLSKPFNRDELFSRIKNLVDLRKSLQQRYQKSALFPLQADLSVKTKMEDKFLIKVKEEFELHLDDEDYGINELCKHLFMSRSQLYRKFKALTDISVHSYLKRLRLSKARYLLITTDLNVSEVALETGFKSLSHFSRTYTEEYGESPKNSKIFAKELN